MATTTRATTWLAIACLIAATALAYRDVGTVGFVWDDVDNIERNAALRDLAGLGRIWTDPDAGIQFFPVWNTTLWLLWRIDGPNPAVFALAGAVLHALCSVLAFLVLRRLLARLGGAGTEHRAALAAGFAAFAFAIHPVHVESIAWSTELKNTVSGALLLAALWHHVRPTAEERPRHRARTIGTSALSVLAILAKPTASVLVPVLVAVDCARGERLGRAVRRHLPLLAFAAAFCLFTAHHERVALGASGAAFARPLLERIALVAHVAWFHAGQLLLLVEPSFFYPRFAVAPDSVATWLPWLGLLAAFAATWPARGANRRTAFACAATFLWFALPTSGLFPFYFHRYGDVQDHFAYLPSLPFLALTGWFAAGACHAVTRSPRAAWATSTALFVAIGGLSLPRTWARVHVFADEETLWRDTLAQNESAFVAHLNLAVRLAARDALPEAITHAQRSVTLAPDEPESRRTLGLLLVRAGRSAEAWPHLDRALELDPGNHTLRRARGIVANALARHDVAVRDLDAVLAEQPADGDAHFAKGSSHLARGEPDLAAWHLEQAARRNPGDIQAWMLLGSAHEVLGEPDEAHRAWTTGLERAERAGDAERARLLREALAQLPR